MLNSLPCVLISHVSRFVVPVDGNCLMRSFRNAQIDWMKVIFNYARIEALHMEWCIVVKCIEDAKVFYVNHKKHCASDIRAVKMFETIMDCKLSDLRNAILDCPVLFRVHKFTLNDSFFPYTAQF